MKKYIVLLLTMLVATFTTSTFAFTPPEKPSNGWYIVDQANKLSAEQKSLLNKKIDSLNKNTKNEFGVLILQTMDGGNIEDVAQSTFRSWGVGKAGLNNGVLLVISVGERKTRLQTGKGAEGDLPDLRAKDILDGNLKPFLKKGDFYGGINSTLDAVSSFMESRANKQAAPNSDSNPVPVGAAAKKTESNNSSGSALLIFLLFGGLVVGGIVIFAVISNRRQKKLEEAEREIYAAQEAARRKRAQEHSERLKAQAVAQAKARQIVNTSSVPPVVSSSTKSASSAPAAKASVNPATVVAATAVGAAAVAATAAAREAERTKRANADREREAAERRAAERRREEEEAAARRRTEESSSSSFGGFSSGSSSSSSYDSGSSYSSGGGFGGGDSGGGGSSGDW